MRAGFSAAQYLSFDVAVLMARGMLYAGALAGPAAGVWVLRDANPVLLAGAILLGAPAACAVFLALLALPGRILSGRIATGVYAAGDSRLRAWSVLSALRMAAESSIFWRVIQSHHLFRQLYCRAMGARIHWDTYIAPGAQIDDPWLLSAGRGVLVGAGTRISGHVVQHGKIRLARVRIGKGALIGGHCLVFPGAEIGDGAVIGAGAVVLPCTVIGTGETWAGVPAVRKKPACDRFPRGAPSVEHVDTPQMVEVSS